MKTFLVIVAAASTVSAQYNGSGAMVRIECEDLTSTCGILDIDMLHLMTRSCAATKLQLVEDVCSDGSTTELFPFREHHVQVTPGYSFGSPGPLDRHCIPSCGGGGGGGGGGGSGGGGPKCSVDCLFFECPEVGRRMLREKSVVRKLSAAPFEATCDLQVAGFTRDGLLSKTCDLSSATCSFTVVPFSL